VSGTTAVKPAESAPEDTSFGAKMRELLKWLRRNPPEDADDKALDLEPTVSEGGTRV
jgi:hypothetical protein